MKDFFKSIDKGWTTLFFNITTTIFWEWFSNMFFILSEYDVGSKQHHLDGILHPLGHAAKHNMLCSIPTWRDNDVLYPCWMIHTFWLPVVASFTDSFVQISFHAFVYPAGSFGCLYHWKRCKKIRWHQSCHILIFFVIIVRWPHNVCVKKGKLIVSLVNINVP